MVKRTTAAIAPRRYFSRSHAKLRGRALVEAAAGAVSGGVEGGGHVVSGLQVLLDLAQTAGVDVGLRSHSQHGLECPLQVECAAAELCRERAQRDAVFDVLLDVAADRAHHRRLRVAVDGVGAAAQAGAESRPSRLRVADRRSARFRGAGGGQDTRGGRRLRCWPRRRRMSRRERCRV